MAAASGRRRRGVRTGDGATAVRSRVTTGGPGCDGQGNAPGQRNRSLIWRPCWRLADDSRPAHRSAEPPASHVAVALRRGEVAAQLLGRATGAVAGGVALDPPSLRCLLYTSPSPRD